MGIAQAEKYFDYRILIGRRHGYTRNAIRTNSCLTICTKKKKMSTEMLGYRDYNEANLTYMYLKGVGYEAVLSLAREIRLAYDWSESPESLVQNFSRTD